MSQSKHHLYVIVLFRFSFSKHCHHIFADSIMQNATRQNRKLLRAREDLMSLYQQ